MAIGGYEVIRVRDGSSAEYVGWAATVDDALALVARAESGREIVTPQCLWETARAAGGSGVPGCSAPGPYNSDPESAEWAGMDGSYGLFPALEGA